MRAHEFNHHQQQQAAQRQMNSAVGPADGPNNSANQLGPRARAHSTSASAESYAYSQPDNSVQWRQQLLHNQLVNQHQHGRQAAHELLGIGQCQLNANSMLTLSSLGHPHHPHHQQTGGGGEIERFAAASTTPLHLQLSPRLLASDSAGHFVDNQHHGQHHQQQRDLGARACQSARPSTVYLVSPGGRQERASADDGDKRREHASATRSCPRSSAAGGQHAEPDGRSNLGSADKRRRSTIGHHHEDVRTRPERPASARESRKARAQPATSVTAAAATAATTTTGVVDDGEDLNVQALAVLRKNSFACTILGARQTGKRSIVICFVKLLNEFKLAADEYKKEKMLTKLVKCSEKLQELASRKEQELEEEEEQQRRQRQRRTSRLNSWLPRGDTVKNLLNLSPVSKKRLHSVAGPLLTAGFRKQSDAARQPHSGGASARDRLACAAADAVTNGDQQQQQQKQRRHTTIEPPSFRLMGQVRRKSRVSENELIVARDTTKSTTTGQFLDVNTAPLHQRSNLLSIHHNKSDSNINYQAHETSFSSPRNDAGTTTTKGAARPSSPSTLEAAAPPRSSGSFQLQVPSWDSVGSKRHSADSGKENDASARTVSSQRRHTTNVTSFELAKRAPPSEQGEAAAGGRDGGREPRCSLSPSTMDEIRARARPRRKSICMSRRRRRALLSLKELNRRKFGIKFSTRRQISESLIEQMREAEQMRAANTGRAGRRKSTIIQLSGSGTTGARRTGLGPLPDAFLVVYSINDR
jgi:hypothetical protein